MTLWSPTIARRRSLTMLALVALALLSVGCMKKQEKQEAQPPPVDTRTLLPPGGTTPQDTTGAPAPMNEGGAPGAPMPPPAAPAEAGATGTGNE